VTVLAIALVVLGLVVVDAVVVLDRVERRSVELPEAPDEVQTWLLVGSDSRAAAGGMPDGTVFGSTRQVPGERADAVVLLQEAAGGQPSRVISIPRDLLVFREGKGIDRLTLTFIDGPASTAKSICRSLGVPVDHVVVVRFDGLRRLVDLVGGIDVWADHDTRDLNTGLMLHSGHNLLDGVEAIAWVRSRHGEQLIDGVWHPDTSGDDSRQSNQRQLLSTLARKMTRSGSDPLFAQRLAWTLSGAIETDDGTGAFDLARLAASMGTAVDSGSLPHTLSDTPIPVASLRPESAEVLESFRHGRPDGPPCPRLRLANEPR